MKRLHNDSSIVIDGNKFVVCMDTESKFRIQTYKETEEYIKHNDVSNTELIVINIAEAFLVMDTSPSGPFVFYSDLAKKFKSSKYINANLHIKRGMEFTPWLENNFDTLECYPYTFNNRTIHRLKLLGNAHKKVEYYRLKPNKHAIFYNAVPQSYRAFLIDNLHENNTIQNTHYSWLIRKEFNDDIIKDWDEIMHHFDWRTRKVLDTTLDGLNTGIQQDKVDDFLYFEDTIFDLAVETVPEEAYLMYTEKTWKPLLMGKLFFILGSFDYYKNLKDMGFELYDEIFDYSFDSIINIDDRFESFCESINNVLKMDIDHLLEKVRKSKIIKKIEHNRDLAWNLNTFDIVMDRYKFFNEDQMTK